MFDAIPRRGRSPLAGIVASMAMAALLGAPPRAACAEGGPLIKGGDRVVFFGDSITEQRMYTRFVQQYFYCRYPDADIRWWNAGWGGDTAGGALERIDRDVLPLKPTVVTLFFGMNDGGYKAKDDEVLAAYKKNMAGIVTKLKAAGSRVIVFTPGCVDPDRQKNGKDIDYNTTLEALALLAMTVARENGCEAVDVFHPMLEYLTARKREDAAYAMHTDGIHPNAEGHLVMTRIMLQGLGAEPMPEVGSVDLATDKAEGLKVEKKSKDEVVLSRTAPSLQPFWFDPTSARGMTLSGFLDRMAGQRLAVLGLAAGDWAVTIDGKDAGTYPAADLAHGVTMAGYYSDRAKEVHDLIVRKETAYYSAWRDTQLPLDKKPGIEDVLKGLATTIEGFHRMVWEAAKAQPTMSITLLPSADGVNYAIHKPYVSSDQGWWGWSGNGNGNATSTALTDGSWETDKEHCYATGNSDNFPKTVTIDLLQPVKIGQVRFGVPDFGSTRSIEVSVSLDGAKYKNVGGHDFSLRKREKFTVTFGGATARYVRLTYKNHHSEKVGGYDAGFCFTTEVEVYAPR